MNNIITAAILALGFTATTAEPVKATGVEFCSALSSSVESMAKARDEGYGPQESYDLMLEVGVPDEMAVVILKLVYVDAIYTSPEELKSLTFSVCLSKAT
jgi:hypothetical protein